MASVLVLYDDIHMAVDYTPSPSKTCVYFEVYRALDSEDPWYMQGDIKWDGCMNLRFSNDDDSGDLHFCDLRQVVRTTEVLQRIYIYAAELMGDNADKELMNG